MKRVNVLLSTAQILAGIAATLLPVGCRERPSQGDPPAEGEVVSESDGDRSERAGQTLAALGYVDYSPEPASAEESGVVFVDPERSYPGYNLVTTVKLRRAELVDSAGKLVNAWHYGEGGGWERSVLLPDGDLLVVSIIQTNKGFQPYFLYRLTWDNELVWKRKARWHHDVTQTPDGTLAGLTWAYRRVPAIHTKLDIMDNLITRFSPDSQSEERRSLYDILSARPDVFSFQKGKRLKAKGKRGKGKPAVGEPQKAIIDLIHANSVRWIEPAHPAADSPVFGAGNVIVCMRHQDSVAIFNWETSELVWVWGQGELEGPHDAHVLDNGNILIFDNRAKNKGSRVIEVDPLSEKIVWQYVAPNPTDFFSKGRGGSQRLPNGNTLITQSSRGRAFEVTPDGEIVWEFYNPHRNAQGHIVVINRCYRYEEDMVERILERVEVQVEPTEKSEKN